MSNDEVHGIAHTPQPLEEDRACGMATLTKRELALLDQVQAQAGTSLKITIQAVSGSTPTRWQMFVDTVGGRHDIQTALGKPKEWLDLAAAIRYISEATTVSEVTVCVPERERKHGKPGKPKQ
jgi:hypothetical protein